MDQFIVFESKRVVVWSNKVTRIRQKIEKFDAKIKMKFSIIL